MNKRRWLLMALAAILSSCASMAPHDPLDVTVAGIESLPGEGMELRLMVKLRVQNPNDAPIDFNGVSLAMDVQGKRLASGVSDQSGSVPRFGEAIVSVPVTISAFRMVRQVLGFTESNGVRKIAYEMSGKLSTSNMFGSVHFSTKGDFDLPAAGASEQ
jgi:LEA14-like dessication related protein